MQFKQSENTFSGTLQHPKVTTVLPDSSLLNEFKNK